MEKLKELLENLKNEVPGFLGGAIVEGKEGLTVVETRAAEDIDLQVSAAYSMEATRYQMRALEALSSASLSTLIGISENHIVLTKPVSNGEFYLHLIVSREKATLGIVTAILSRYASLFEEAMKGWFAS